MGRIFLSHTHVDKPFARKLASDLIAAGHFVWIDEAEILLGDSLLEKISDGIRQVDFLAALLSNASVSSEWVKRELEIAINREITSKKVFVLPLLIEDATLPEFLVGNMYADFRNTDKYKSSLSLILHRLEEFDTSNTDYESFIEQDDSEKICLNCEFYWSLTMAYYGGWGICSNEQSEYHDVQCLSDGGCKYFKNSRI